MRTSRLNRLVFLHVPLWVYLLATIVPIGWVLLTSLKFEPDISTYPLIYFPQRLTLENYTRVWNYSGLWRFVLNSTIVSGLTTLVVIVITGMAGYSLARYNFRFKRIFMLLLLSIQMVPAVMLVLPLFQILNSVRLLNTYASLVLPYATFMITFCTLMMRGYFQSIPRDLEEMAMIDGCSELQALRNITMPLAAPGIVATGIFAFIYAWNELVLAVMLIRSESMQTLPVGLNSIIGQFHVEWGQIAAGSIFALLPTILLFAFVQKYLVQGMTAGSVK